MENQEIYECVCCGNLYCNLHNGLCDVCNEELDVHNRLCDVCNEELDDKVKYFLLYR